MAEAVPLHTRLAPTPSGLLHVGNGASFVIAHRLAKESGGTVRLRIDDLDAERVRPEYLSDVFDTLAWLRLKYDVGPSDPADHIKNWSQRFRIPRYREELERLWNGGHLYACTCTRTTAEPCSCAGGSIDRDDPQATWRLRVPAEQLVQFKELNGVERVLRLAEVMPDPVLRQRPKGKDNGRPAYQIASLLDDVDQDINLIVRGEDLLPSTACQLYLAELLGHRSFLEARFVHHDLVADEKGGKLSKSDGAASLRAWREADEGPELVFGLAARLWSAE